MAGKSSKNQSDFVRSSLILVLLLAVAIGILFFMRSKGRQDSLLEKPAESAATETEVKKRNRVDVLPNIPIQNSGADANASATSQATGKDSLELQKAMQLIDGGQWREAESILLAILQKDPRDEGALIEMAMLLLIDKQDSRAAQPYLERALEVNPDNEAAVQELLGVYEETRNWDQGLAFLRSMQDDPRKTGYVDYGIGSALVSMGRPAEAIPALQKSVYEYGYKEYSARQGLAEALVDSGRIDEGIREYQQIIEGPYKPNQIRVAKIRTASALIEKQQFAEARRILQPLQDTDPKDEWVAALLRDIDNKQKF
ncbi:MAG TPA: tetratricopeptide repeat protein [Oligoflexus sp.]|uniref:tetratricopeptide repeat protein n=1 Tax=Oligoflexus sp. TaxID=1971216 RepID=UPI002D52B523|nr:tetratricopeptide repeat protein [Oligoflexus sp.]HYX35861.1 tetratricopeptide repeat protein [Oligoflexus sp.]